MPLESDAVAGATIELLEARLHRLTYLLTGDAAWTGEPAPPSKPSSLDETVTRRLLKLERDLEKLSRAVPAVRDVTQLHDRFPDLVRPTSTSTSAAQTQSQSQDHEIPESLPPQTLAAIVLSYTTAFPETASRLASLNDLPIPDAQASAALIELLPRLDAIAQAQNEQAGAVAELRMRSARVLQRWYEVGIVGGAECWGEWEGRLEGAERGVRRREVERERRED